MGTTTLRTPRGILRLVLVLAVWPLAGAPPRVRADDGDPREVLSRAAARLRALRSLSADLEVRELEPRPATFGGTVRLERPNRARVEIVSPARMVVVSDGRDLQAAGFQPGRTTRKDPGPGGERITVAGIPLVELFFDPALIEADGEDLGVRVAGAGETLVGDVSCRLVDLEFVDALDDPLARIQLAIGPDDLPVRTILVTPGRVTRRFQATWTDLRTDVGFDEGTFRFEPPPENREEYLATEELLRIGTGLPVLDLGLLGAGSFDLPSRLAASRACLISFWYRACGPCREELPKIQALARRYAGRGLDVITVNRGDAPPAIEAFLRAQDLDLPVLLGPPPGDPAAELYRRFRISGFPANYLVDPQGRILFRSVGYDPWALYAALRRAGIR